MGDVRDVVSQHHHPLPRIHTYSSVPWSSDRVNVAEVRHRLELSRNPYLNISIARDWTVHATPWRGRVLEPHKIYVVAVYHLAYDPSEHTFDRITSVDANVMRFVAREQVSPQRAAVVDEWLVRRRENELFIDDADQTPELAKYLHVFEDLATGKRFRIDVFGWGIDRHDGLRIQVMDVVSSSWYIRPYIRPCANPSTTWYIPPYAENRANRAIKSMRSIRRCWERGVAADVAAMTIQRAWLRARADPAHPICRARLQAEFDELSSICVI